MTGLLKIEIYDQEAEKKILVARILATGNEIIAGANDEKSLEMSLKLVCEPYLVSMKAIEEKAKIIAELNDIATKHNSYLFFIDTITSIYPTASVSPIPIKNKMIEITNEIRLLKCQNDALLPKARDLDKFIQESNTDLLAWLES